MDAKNSTQPPAAQQFNHDALRVAVECSPVPKWHIAANAGLHASMLSEMLGGRRVPSPAVVARLAKVLGVAPADLYTVKGGGK